MSSPIFKQQHYLFFKKKKEINYLKKNIKLFGKLITNLSVDIKHAFV